MHSVSCGISVSYTVCRIVGGGGGGGGGELSNTDCTLVKLGELCFSHQGKQSIFCREQLGKVTDGNTVYLCLRHM